MIVPNNDVRAEINKQRARRFAAERHAQVLWCFAKDSFPNATLSADPNMPARKVEFLQKHDRECADLAGMVPLVVGLPITLSEHVDRDRGMLRGTLCRISGWQLSPEETALPSTLPEAPWKHIAPRFCGSSPPDNEPQIPRASKVMLQEMVQVVWVEVLDAGWALPDLPAGTYPIKPTRGSWFVDKQNKTPQLLVHRQQLPLLPAFACTANAAQGGNWQKAIADVNIASGMSPQAAYVALSRVPCRTDIWILRPFPRHMFARKGRIGPDLLLQKLRGETINWQNITEQLMSNKRTEKHQGTPHLNCLSCDRLVPATQFTVTELANGMQRRCGICLSQARCTICDSIVEGITCASCRGLKQCRACGEWKLPSEMSKKQSQRPCGACNAGAKLFSCGRCTLILPLLSFRRCAAATPSLMLRPARRRCDSCQEEEDSRRCATHTAARPELPEKKRPSKDLPCSALRSRTKRQRAAADAAHPTASPSCFFQKQTDAHCGMCALNNALQERIFDRRHMEDAATQYMAAWSDMDRDEEMDAHIHASGWYSFQVMYAALFSQGLTLLDERILSYADADRAVALIQNRNNIHWIAYRKIRESMVKLDSLQDGPLNVTPEDLLAELHQFPTYGIYRQGRS